MSSNGLWGLLAAAPHRQRLPDSEVHRLYPRYRLRIMESTFFGYAAFYLVRNNLSVVSRDMQGALHYDASMLGNILAVTAITYGLGKFLMGSVSDRSNPRVFMAIGLLMTAACNFAFGSVSRYPVHLLLWGLNGFFQGMGWPPCGRSMGHWFAEHERGLTFSIWNTSHNLGGGLAGIIAAWAATRYGDWRYAFYFPGILAAIGSIYIFVRLRDTPQSVGLPPIEEYRRGGAFPVVLADSTGLPGAASEIELPICASPTRERELSTRELLLGNALLNRTIWLLAIANFFAYVTRYSMLDWGPLYLREVKNATLTGGGLAVFLLEFGGIPSTILLGWLSDLIGGRRGMVAALSLLPILAAFTGIMLTPPGYLWLDMSMLVVIGCFIYPVINLIVIMALDATSKKAIGTAAGFIGMIGYTGRTCQAAGFGWMLDHFTGRYGVAVAWKLVLLAILGCTLVAMVLLAFTWHLRPRNAVAAAREANALPPPSTAEAARQRA